MDDSQIIVTIKNYEKFNPRKDIKHSSWFRKESNIFENPDFFDFDHSDLVAWDYLLSLASKKNSGTIHINFRHVEVIGRFKKDKFLNALKKLEQNQSITVDVTPTLRERDVHDTSRRPTNERTNERTNDIVQKRVLDDLDLIYEKYPRKEGKQKGMEIFKREVKNGTNPKEIEFAIEAYSKHCKSNRIEPKFIKQFSTFMSSWRDWTDAKAGKVEFQKPKIVAPPVPLDIEYDPRPDDPEARARATEKIKALVKTAFSKPANCENNS